MATKVSLSTGNVFYDLGLEPEEAENLRLRSDLMIELAKLLEPQGLTQVAAAKVLGVAQPRISDLVWGRIDRFSVDELIAMLCRVGANVSFVVTLGQRPCPPR